MHLILTNIRNVFFGVSEMKYLITLFLLLTTPVFAQQADPAFLQKAITAVQTQRNLAMDQAAVAQAKAAGLAEELAKAQARIKELEPKPEPDKPK